MFRHIIFIAFLATNALAQYPESYVFENKSNNYDCKIELKLDAGSYQSISINSKLIDDHVLSDEDIAFGNKKAWPQEIILSKELDHEKLLWKEGELDGIKRKLPQESIEVTDKLKVFFNSTDGSFRSVVDIYVKIVPFDYGKAANIFLVGTRNSKESAAKIIAEKFPDTSKKVEGQDSNCFNMDFKPTSPTDASGIIWTSKTLIKKTIPSNN